MSSALSALSARHTRQAAMDAIERALNAARESALTTAQAAHVAAYGVAVERPVDGPVLQVCRQDDPRDLRAVSVPNETPKIVTALILHSGVATPGDIIDADMDEPVHAPELEWTLLIPPKMDTAEWQDVRNRGLAEIESILLPLTGSFLTDADDNPVAVSFDIARVQPLTEDLGDWLMSSTVITFSLTLDALSVLS